MRVDVLLFPEFETLDAFGPVEIFGRVNECELHFISIKGGLVSSSQGVFVMTEKIDLSNELEVFLVPGGMGTRSLVNNEAFIHIIKTLAQKAAYCLTVCTGSVLLAKTGLLDARRATSNKRSFAWVKEQCHEVKWQGRARWVVDGKFYTSSGVSAGMDMAFGFIADCFGQARAVEIAARIEYVWNADKDRDDFEVD